MNSKMNINTRVNMGFGVLLAVILLATAYIFATSTWALYHLRPAMQDLTQLESLLESRPGPGETAGSATPAKGGEPELAGLLAMKTHLKQAVEITDFFIRWAC